MKLKMKMINFKRRQYIFLNFENKNLWEEEYDLEQLQSEAGHLHRRKKKVKQLTSPAASILMTCFFQLEKLHI